MVRAKIIGTGMYVPELVLNNNFFVEIGLDTSDEWIYSRTGIKQRRFAEIEKTSDLAVNAGFEALRDAGVRLDDIDLLAVATTTPDQEMPPTAAIVKEKMGINNSCPAEDINAACSGFVFGLAEYALQIEEYNTVLLIGAENMTRYLDYKDRSTCILFGDGAGAVVLRTSEHDRGVLASVKFTEPGICSLLGISEDRVYMDGPKVFQFAIRVVPDAINAVLKKADVSISDISWIVPHQANDRILKKAAQNLGFPFERMFSNIASYGNTSAASVPIALHELKPKLNKGDLIVLVGFGAGGTYGAVLIEW